MSFAIVLAHLHAQCARLLVLGRRGLLTPGDNALSADGSVRRRLPGLQFPHVPSERHFLCLIFDEEGLWC